MADAGIPGAVFNQNPNDIPLESQPVGFARGIAATASAATESSLGVSLEARAIGNLEGGDELPRATVEKVFKDQKLDPHVLPKTDTISRGVATAIFGQQLTIQKQEDLAQRAHLGGLSSGVAGFVGGMADPLVLGAGLIGGPLLGAAKTGLGIESGAPLAARIATGAAEGAAVTGAYAKGQQVLGTAQGNRDITSGDIMHQALWGSVGGAVLKGAFGEAPVERNLEPYRQMIVGAENSAGYAKAHGIPVSDVVSNKGAVGLYQITPDTAKSLGFNPDNLKDPIYNQQVAMANLEKLHKQFGDDPEAIAIAWNAGPGAARKFIRGGRDRSKLPKETQDYLAKIDKNNGTPPPEVADMTPAEAQAAGKASVPEPGTVKVKAYHGTAADFADYDTAKAGEATGAKDATAGGATFFTSDPDVAAGYANFATRNLGTKTAEATKGFHKALNEQAAEPGVAVQGQNIRPVDLSFKNPQTVDWAGQNYSQTGFAKAIVAAKAAGHDGVIFKNVQDDVGASAAGRLGKYSDVYASFKPNEAARPSFGLPPDTQVHTAKAAVAQAGEDSEINIKPVIDSSLAEKSGKKIDPQELGKAIPERDSSFFAQGQKEKLAAFNEAVATKSSKGFFDTKEQLEARQGKANPAVAELQAMAKNAIKEAEASHFVATNQAADADVNGFHSELEREEEALEKSEGAPELDKAIDAGFRCAVAKGTE